MSNPLDLTASGLIRALSPQHLQSTLAKQASQIARKLEAELGRDGAEVRASAETRNGTTTIDLTGPNLWQREYGSIGKPESGRVASAVQTVTGDS